MVGVGKRSANVNTSNDQGRECISKVDAEGTRDKGCGICAETWCKSRDLTCEQEGVR